MTTLAAALAAFEIAAHRWHLPAYTVIAIAGILTALWLSQHTARVAGLSPARVWDAGVFAVLTAFIVSRVLGIALLLAIEHGHLTLSFWDALRLSSISDLSLLVTGLLALGWIRWKRLPLLRVLDAWAPCAALLWAALSIAEAASGVERGLPTRWIWGVHAAGLPKGVRVQPANLYAAVIAAILCCGLLLLLRLINKPGRVAGLALVAGSLGVFLLDMVRPPQPFGWLDSSQWIALAGIAAGALLLLLPRPAREETR